MQFWSVKSFQRGSNPPVEKCLKIEVQMSHFFVWQGHTSKIPYVSVISVIFRRTFMTTDKTYVLKGRTSNKWSRNIVSHYHSDSFAVKTSSSAHSICRAEVLHHTSATPKQQSSTFSSLNPGLSMNILNIISIGFQSHSLCSHQLLCGAVVSLDINDT